MHPQSSINPSPLTMQTIKVVDAKYQIKDKKLGEGSFAKTYLSLNSKNNQISACKMISKKGLIEKINTSKNKALTKDYFISALKNEVSTWKSLKHPNIVEFKDFSETSNNIYFFLQFCPGGNLQTLLKMRGHIKQSETIQMLIQLSKGCEYLYDKGIFHRDIKTQNILISEKGLKISDFGFAKMINDEEMKNNPTDGTCVGTPIYMSPQVILSEPYTIKCDVWSLGIVFYRILYNLYPWQRTDNLHQLIDRMKKEIMFPPHIQVDDWLKDLIGGMMAVEEEHRLSIKDVRQILQKYVQTMMQVE